MALALSLLYLPKVVEQFLRKCFRLTRFPANFDHIPHEILVRAVQHISKRFEHVALWIDAYLAVVSEGIGPLVEDDRPQKVSESAANGIANDQGPLATEDCEMSGAGASPSNWPQSPRFSPLRSPRLSPVQSPKYVPGSAWNSAFT